MTPVFTVILVLTGVRLGPALRLFFNETVTQPVALAKCQQYGMTLLELRTQEELDDWNIIKYYIFTLQQPGYNVEPWLGLVHDETLSKNLSNFRWLDAGTVDWATWPPGSGEPDHLDLEKCVRVRDGKFGTRECSFYPGFSTACQALMTPNDSLDRQALWRKETSMSESVAITPYQKSKNSAEEVPLWLSSLSTVTVTDYDVDECVRMCHVQRDCIMVAFILPNRCSSFSKVI